MTISRKRVLWIDDEVEYLRSHIMFLETRGYSVTPVFSGEDGLHLLRKDPQGYDIVLLDEQMPGKNGLDTLVDIKDMLPDLPVVMVTKSEEEQVMETALGLKIDGYLTKPVNPSQILSVCKKILHQEEIQSSKVKNDFVRSFSGNRDLLRNKKGCKEWEKLYISMTRWDIELAGIRDEGIRQAQNGLRADADTQFYDWVFHNYMEWVDTNSGPMLSHQVLPQYAYPVLEKGGKVCVVVLDSMRLDHYLAIQPLLKQFFAMDNALYWSVLPTSPEYARTALVTGMNLSDVAASFPEEFNNILDAGTVQTSHEGKMFKKRMCLPDIGLTESEVSFINIPDENAAQILEDGLEALSDKRAIVLNINFINSLMFESGDSPVVGNIASDETALRTLVANWFERSSLLRTMEKIADDGFTVVFTTSGGSVLSTRGTEYYGTDRPRTNIRFRRGEGITCDERFAMFVYEPAKYRLPAVSEETRYIILKENYYFVEHDVYQNYNAQYRPAFQRGGISMEEMIVPIAVLTSKVM